MKKNKPVISEIKYVTIGVENLKRSMTFYRDVFGYAASDITPISGKDLERAWRMPAGLKGRSLVMNAPGIDSGMLRLVEFNKKGERIWGDCTPWGVIGLYAINYAVRDLNAFWPRLIKAGAVSKAPPKFWRVNDDLSAWDSQAYDTDGVLMDIFQVVNSDRAVKLNDGFTSAVSEVQTMAIHVQDAVCSKTFYQGLGFNKLFYETTIENLEQFFGVPAGTKLYNINLMNQDYSTNGRIELAEYIGFDSNKSLKERSVPPNTGVLSISFETDDIAGACRLARELGAQIISEPVRVKLPKIGEARIATVFGPDGEALEFYQPI